MRVYQEHGKWAYSRRYKKRRLRRKGFATKAEAEAQLRKAMNDVDAEERGEVRTAPTTCGEALKIYRRKLEVRAKDKPHGYGANIAWYCQVLQEFVDSFGPSRQVRAITETDLREFYQTLCFRMARNSARANVARLQGMLKAAQEARPDLVNWLRPKLRMKDKTEYERRVVEPSEYAALVKALLNPSPTSNHYAAIKANRLRKPLWRDAADCVQLLRLTGGRLNEVLRMTLEQFDWSKGIVKLFASKTEDERDLPITDGIRNIVQSRIREGLTDNYVFPRARVATFDNNIARVCREAAKQAKLNYGQKNGFTLHSLRHTFITDLLRQTNNDVGTVMRYSGHKSLKAFSKYLHPSDEGCKLAMQALEKVGRFLAALEGKDGQQGLERDEIEAAKLLEMKEVSEA